MSIRKTVSGKVGLVDASQLSFAEEQLLAAFRRGDDRRLEELLAFAKVQTSNFPRRVKPSFCLIVGGAA